MKEEVTALFTTVEADVQWAKRFIAERVDHLKNPGTDYVTEDFLLAHLPPLISEESSYSRLEALLDSARSPESPEWLPTAERLLLILVLAPQLSPSLLEPFSSLLAQGVGTDRLGGVKNNRLFGFVPTGDTLLFLLAGENVPLRQKIIGILFSTNHTFLRHDVLSLNEEAGLPRFSGALSLSEEYYSLLVKGEAFVPVLSPSFPAQPIHTEETWDDLVTGSQTRFALEEINIWIKENKRMMADQQVSRKIKKGYRALFYGSSGTGKTMAAGLIGKDAGVPVFRVDLSAVVSKYIGETEKNLGAIFDKAENRDWILFFDEADALFGKRTQTSSANDRYANQEVSYLLQRVENFNGLVILSTNLKANMDTAFTRRFQTMIHFPVPDEPLREELFRRAFQGKYEVENTELLDRVVKKFQLTGAEINNIFRYCAMMCLHYGHEKVTEKIFSEGVTKELRKKGKSVV